MSELIQNAKADLAAGKEAKTTVRTLLAAFGSRRRRANVVETIRDALQEAGLVTVPDFTSTWIDAEIAFTEPPQEIAPADAGAAPDAPDEAEAELKPSVEPKEAMQLIRMLSAANRGVLSVKPQDTLEVAITLMLAQDYSQLPVMTGPRDLKGVVSWKSIGGRLAQRSKLLTVADAMEPGVIVKETDSLFEVTTLVISNDFVFVASVPDNRIIGIVTATDLSEQFQTLSEPFLLIGQIENQIRNLMHDRFDLETLRAACNDNDPARRDRVSGIADLTFGEYIRILEIEANWSKLDFVADRATFINAMDRVREIRNDVMHFDPDGIEDDQFLQLRKFSRFLTRLERLSGGRTG
ncbi:MAG: CBS domain-containing protein [Mesorhizobium sp.]|nr:MAG: CBS domain-containing protein [Mesorhizobium sp.]